MQVIYNDEYGRLTPEMRSMMEQAANVALETEFSGFSSDKPEHEPEVGVTIADDSTILELNREYRGKDSVTDVLSFPQFTDREELLEDLLSDGSETLIGDVVICYEQAERQAEEYSTGMTREMLYLFVHSIMHLFGYDHMEEDEKAVMRKREEEVLSAVGAERR